MEQLNFDVPIVRRTDPKPSHEGADYQKASGNLEGDRGLVLKTLRYHPNSTGAELARIIFIQKKDPKHRNYEKLMAMARKRLGELTKWKKGEPPEAQVTCHRNCTKEGSLSTAYEITAAGLRLVRK